MGKLVRDNIPQIIRDDGAYPVTRELDKEEYMDALLDKMDEEYGEFRDEHDIEEVADLLEVLRSYLKLQGSSMEEVEVLRKKKLKVKGGFEKKIYLEEIKE